MSAIFDTVGALVVVLDSQGRIIRFNRACEQTTGYSFEEVRAQAKGSVPGSGRCRALCRTLDLLRRGVVARGLRKLLGGQERRAPPDLLVNYGADGERGEVAHIIATGIDVTERKRLERAVLDISSREQRRIGQDLHDGLGQHLTGIAFMGKVLQDRLAEASLREDGGSG